MNEVGIFRVEEKDIDWTFVEVAEINVIFAQCDERSEEVKAKSRKKKKKDSEKKGNETPSGKYRNNWNILRDTAANSAA